MGNAAMSGATPGYTLADSTGTKRIRMLEESRQNLVAHMLDTMDKIGCIDHELEQIRAGWR